MTYIIVEWSGGGGIGHYSFLLADGIEGSGVRTILATRAGHELGALPHRHTIASLWPRAPRFLRGRARTVGIAAGWAWGWVRLVGLVARSRGDRDLVVHVHAPESVPELVFLSALRLLSPHLVITAHNAVPHDYATRGKAVNRLVYRLPHAIVTQSEADAATVRSIAGLKPRVTVIPHGSYAPIADWIPSDEPVGGDSLIIAHLGSIRPYKGFGLVLEAFRLAAAEDTRLHLRVVGRAADEAEAAALLDTLPPGRWSAHLGYATIEDLVRESRQADIVLLGHRRASESGILHLALATGTPVVGPDIAGIARLLATVPTWLYRAGDPEDAARAVLRLAASFPADRTAARQMARHIIERSAPSWDEVARAHLEFVFGVEWQNERNRG